MAREFEDAVIDVLYTKTMRALNETDARTLIVGGGVVANKQLRKVFEEKIASRSDIILLAPIVPLATDNATMIGIAAYIRWHATPTTYGVASPDATTLRAEGNLAIAAR